MKQFLKITGYVLLSVLVCLYLVFLFVLPRKIDLNVYKSELQKIVKENTNLYIDFDRVDVITSPLLEAGIKTSNIEVKLPDGSLLFSADSFKGKVFLPSLLWLTVRVSQAEVDSPKLNVEILNGEKYKVAKVYEDLVNKKREQRRLNPPSFTEESGQLPFDPSIIKLIIPNLKLDNYEAVIDDIKSSHKLTLKGEQLKLGYFNGKVAKLKTNAEFLSDKDKNITADLQGRYPWTEEEPLLLTDVSVDVLGGNVLMKQLRMPQHDPALLRLNNLSSSELVSAVNPKQFAMSGAFSGALPLWLNNEKWIVKDGWLANSGPMTLRLDKDTADAVVKDNMTAGSAINWLRYMEISRSSTKINLDNLGLLTMQANITGTSRVDGKSGTVNLNYYHEENIFTLWRSLRFGDNLQAWLEQNARLPGNDCPQGKECEEKQ